MNTLYPLNSNAPLIASHNYLEYLYSLNFPSGDLFPGVLFKCAVPKIIVFIL